MSDWNSTSWDFFYDSEHRPGRVFLSTFGLDADFLSTELLPGLMHIGGERETSDWYLEMEKTLNDCPVDVAVDSRAWGKGTRSIIFQELGGYVHPVLVSQGSQHSKLWLAEYEEFVRIVIGSANLTRNAFCNQIQYLWMADLEKKPLESAVAPSNENIQRLQEFLRHLGKTGNHRQSSGSESETASNNRGARGNKRRMLDEVLEGWCELLGTVTWPSKATLIPCIPSVGQEDSVALEFIYQSLPKNRKYHLDIQVFSVGQVQGPFIEEIRTAFRAVKSMNLFWPEETVPHVPWRQMILSPGAKAAWMSAGGCFFRLDFDSHHINNAQARLPHGKIYAGCTHRNQDHRYDWLFLGSSNLSETAWKHSFELNVLLRGDGLPLPLDYTRCNVPIVPYCTAPPDPDFGPIRWLEAQETKEGVEVTLYGGSLDACTIELLDGAGRSTDQMSLSQWVMNTSQLLSCSGKGVRRVVVIVAKGECPEHIILECEVIPLLDSHLGKIDGTGKTAPQLRHEWILKRYDWDPKRSRPGRRYRVDWLEECMNLFRVIDRWREKGKDRQDRDDLKAAFDFFATSTPQTGKQIAFEMAAKEIMKW